MPYYILLISIIVFIILCILTLVTTIFGAPYVVSDRNTSIAVIELAKRYVNKKMIFADLGSGDGRIVIAFAKMGLESHGFEINPFLVIWSRFRIRRKGLSNKAFIHWKSYWAEDLGKYNAVFIFGISYIMAKIEAKLVNQLKCGSLIITHTFSFPNIKPASKKDGVFIYLI